MHLDDEDVEHRNRMEMNGIFSWELGKGEHSRILFRKDGVELAELYITQRMPRKCLRIWAFPYAKYRDTLNNFRTLN